MNIFVVDEDPDMAARDLCDRHNVKMITESAQMLCSAFRNKQVFEGQYRSSHFNHPCTIWARTTPGNYTWLVEHGLALGREYTRRYHREHKSVSVIQQAFKHMHLIEFARNTSCLTDFAQAMPDECKVVGDAVSAYRNYYLAYKRDIATWWYSDQPAWWI